MPQPLTPRQAEVLDVIRDFLKEFGFAPTFDELSDRLGISKSSIHEHLQALEKKGAIRRADGGRARNIEVVGREMVVLEDAIEVVQRVLVDEPNNDRRHPEHAAEDITEALNGLKRY